MQGHRSLSTRVFEQIEIAMKQSIGRKRGSEEGSQSGEEMISLSSWKVSPLAVGKYGTACRRLQVHFDDQQQSHPAHFELDERYLQALWHSPLELAAIKEDARKTLRAFRRAGGISDTINDDEECIRGLEDWGNPSGILDKKKRVKCIINGVLEEQANQRQMRINDPKGLQVLSCACSKYAKERALLQGRRDEQEMRNIKLMDIILLPALVTKDGDGVLQASANFTETLTASFNSLALSRERVKSSSARSA